MLTYFFVFGVVLRARFGTIRTPLRLRALLPGRHAALAGLQRSRRPLPHVLLEHRNFVKKLVFAVETLPVNLVVSGLVSEVLRGRAVLRVPAGRSRHELPPTVLWLPVLLVPQMLFTAGVSWFLAALGVVRARPRPDHRLPADDLVFPDAHLLS